MLHDRGLPMGHDVLDFSVKVTNKNSTAAKIEKRLRTVNGKHKLNIKTRILLILKGFHYCRYFVPDMHNYFSFKAWWFLRVYSRSLWVHEQLKVVPNFALVCFIYLSKFFLFSYQNPALMKDQINQVLIQHQRRAPSPPPCRYLLMSVV